MIRPLLNRIKGMIQKTQSISDFEDVLFLDEEQKRALNQSVSNFNIISKLVKRQMAAGGSTIDIDPAAKVLDRIYQEGLSRVPTELEAGERIKVEDATEFMGALGELKNAMGGVSREVAIPLSDLVEEFRKQAFVYADNGEQTKDSIKGLYSVINIQMEMAKKIVTDLESKYGELSEEQITVLESHREYLKKMEHNTEKIEPLLNIDSDTLQSSEEMRTKLQSIFKEISDDTNEVKMYHQMQNIDSEIGRLSVNTESLDRTMAGMRSSGKREIASKIDLAEMAKKPLRGMLDYAMESTGLGFLNELGITDAIGSGIKGAAGLGAGAFGQLYQGWNTRRAVRRGMQDAVGGGRTEMVPQLDKKSSKWKVGAQQNISETGKPSGWSVRRKMAPAGRGSTSARQMVAGGLGALESNLGGTGSMQVGTLYVQNLVGAGGNLGGAGIGTSPRQEGTASKKSIAASKRIRGANGRFMSVPEVVPEVAPLQNTRRWTVRGRHMAQVPGATAGNMGLSEEINNLSTGGAPTRAGRFGGMLGKTGGLIGKVGRFAGPLGLALSAGFALKDAAGGWGSARDTFGLAPGKKVSTGQKMASAAGGALSGLSFGLLPSDIIAKGLYGLGGIGGATLGIGGKALKGIGSTTLNLGKTMLHKIKDFGEFLSKLNPSYWIARGISALFKGQDKGEESIWKNMSHKIKSFGSFLLKLTPGYWVAKLLGHFLDKKKNAQEQSENKGIISRIQNYMTSKIQALKNFIEYLNPLTWGKKALGMLGRGGSAVLGAVGGAAGTVTKWAGDALGNLSAKHESGNMGTEAVGWDKTGGASYGKYQLSTKKGSLSRFLTYALQNNPDLYKQLVLSGDPSQRGGKFEKTWKQLATDESGDLPDLEHKFVRQEYFTPAFNNLNKESLRGRVSEDKNIQEVLWSTAVQHGSQGASDIFNKVYKEEMSNKELIKALYDERKKQFGDSTPDTQKSVLKRLSDEMLEVMSKIEEGTEDVWDSTKGFMENTWNKIKSLAEDTGGFLSTLASQGVKSTEDLMSKFMDNGINTVEDVLQYLKDTGGEGLSEIQKLAKEGISKLGDLIPKLAKMGGAGLKGLLGLAVNLTKKAGELVLDSIGAIGKLFFHEDMNLAGKTKDKDLQEGEAYGMGPKLNISQFRAGMMEGVHVTPTDRNSPMEQFQDSLYQREGKAVYDPNNKFNKLSSEAGSKLKGLFHEGPMANLGDKVNSGVSFIKRKIGQTNKESIIETEQNDMGQIKNISDANVQYGSSLDANGIPRIIRGNAKLDQDNKDVNVRVQNPTPEDSTAVAEQYRSNQKQEQNKQQMSPPVVVQPAPQPPAVLFDKRTQVDDLGLILLNADFLG